MESLATTLRTASGASGATFTEYGLSGGRVVVAQGAMAWALGQPVASSLTLADEVERPFCGWVESMPLEVVQPLRSRGIVALAGHPVRSGERAVGVSFEYVAWEMKRKGAPVEMVIPKEGAGYEMEANALTKKGARSAAARQFLDWAISDEAMRLYARYFAAVGVAGLPVPEGLPKDVSKVVYPNDFDWSAKNRDRILAEWSKRYESKAAPK